MKYYFVAPYAPYMVLEVALTQIRASSALPDQAFIVCRQVPAILASISCKGRQRTRAFPLGYHISLAHGRQVWGPAHSSRAGVFPSRQGCTQYMKYIPAWFCPKNPIKWNAFRRNQYKISPMSLRLRPRGVNDRHSGSASRPSPIVSGRTAGWSHSSLEVVQRSYRRRGVVHAFPIGTSIVRRTV